MTRLPRMHDSAIRLREWSRQEFHEPESVLSDLGGTGVGFIPDGQHPEWVPLRGNALNRERQWLDAVVFTLGLRRVLGLDVRLAQYEAEDFDFLVSWPADGEQYACPVQLKEVVPEHRNASADLNALIASLKRYPPSIDTIVAIKLNRAGDFDPRTLQVPALPFAQVWLFGCQSQDKNRWFLYGDLLTAPEFSLYRVTR
jgi:hypothetical protein